MWFSLQTGDGTQIKLVALFVLFVFSLLNIVNCASLSTNAHLNGSSNCSNSLCQTDSCELYGQALQGHMKLSADPCHDFHAYVCGNPQLNTASSYTWNQETILKKVESILQTEKQVLSKSNSKAVRYVVDLYHECLNVSKREQVGVEPMLILLKDVLLLDHWSLDSTNLNLLSSQIENEIDLDSSSNKNSAYTTLRENSSSDTEQDFQVSWNSWIKSNRSSMSDEPLDVGHWMDIFVEASLIDADFYEKIMNLKDFQISPKFYNSENIDDLHKIFSDFKKSLLTLFDADKWNTSFDRSIFEVLYFYKNLSKIREEKYLKLEGNLIIHQNITLKDLNTYYSSDQFDWMLLLNKFAYRIGASVGYTDEDKVGVRLDELPMLKPLTELIANTPIRVLRNSIALQILSYSPHSSLLWNENMNFKQYQRACIFNQKLPIISSVFTRLLVEQLGRERMRTARDHVIKMSVQVKDTFRDSLQQEHVWLDEQTRQSALDKLDAIKFNIGFPDWIFEDDALDEEHGFDIFSNDEFEDSLQAFKGHYAVGYLNLVRILNAAKFRNTKISYKIEFHSYLEGEGFYDSDLNLVELSVPLLSEPVLNVDYPVEIIYGRIGSIIGHEIIHAFDGTYRLFDKHGNYVNWWTDSASEYFDYLSRCFVFKYNGLVEPITGFELNGSQTLDENIADNGGLRQAYRAFEHNLKQSINCNSIPQKASPFLAQFPPEQLFFISYSTSYCGFYSENSTDQMYDHFQAGAHSPGKFRVNVPLASMGQFAQAFNCPVGSRMNPVHKCILW